MNNALFHEAEIIQSINFDQHQILRDIIKLYCPRGIELDPTYNVGGFYRAGVKRPRHIFDIKPLRPECGQADCRQLPLGTESIKTAIFDPPFFAGGGNAGHMSKKYSCFETMEDLWELYGSALSEFYRILIPLGILIFKCQDSVHGRRNYFTHVWVANKAEEAGFRSVDLFIKLNKSAMRPYNMKRQNHARKMHSYFWVFQKPSRSRESAVERD